MVALTSRVLGHITRLRFSNLLISHSEPHQDAFSSASMRSLSLLAVLQGVTGLRSAYSSITIALTMIARVCIVSSFADHVSLHASVTRQGRNYRTVVVALDASKSGSVPHEWLLLSSCGAAIPYHNQRGMGELPTLISERAFTPSSFPSATQAANPTPPF